MVIDSPSNGSILANTVRSGVEWFPVYGSSTEDLLHSSTEEDRNWTMTSSFKDLHGANLTNGVELFSISPFNSSDKPSTSAYVVDQFAFKFYAISVCGFGIAIIGLIGNFLSFLVLAKEAKTKPIFFILLSLAVCDTLALISYIMSRCIAWFYPYLGVLKNALALVKGNMNFFMGIKNLFITTSAYTLVVVTANRYIQVCLPFRAKTLCTMSKIKWEVFIVLVVAAVLNVPRFYEWKIGPPVDGVPTISVQPHRNHTMYFTFYTILVYTVLVVLLPLLLLILLNAGLIIALRRNHKNRKSLGVKKDGTHRKNLTLILVIVVGAFVISDIPVAFVQIMLSVPEYGGIPKTILGDLSAFGDVMLIFNSSVNFYAYMLAGQFFRERLVGILCGCTCRRGASLKDVQDAPTADVSREDATSSTRVSAPETSQLSETNTG